MKVLVTGAAGLIGGAVAARIAAAGHSVVAVSRSGSFGAIPLAAERMVLLDAERASVDDWAAALKGVDAVVNCIGVLQDSPRENTEVHAGGADRLFGACEAAGVRRVVHFSAMGVDRAQPSSFSASKLAGDRALMARDLDWVILRPSVVLGRRAFGASALFRGLAGLPVAPEMGGTGALQAVQLDDVARTVAALVEPDAPARLVLELAGPERLSMREIVARYRRWLGWPPARPIELPGGLAHLLYRAGDAAARFGWRPPMRSTARREIGRGATGDPARWTEMTGIVPQSLDEAMVAEPAGVQERWFARLYFLKPAIFAVLSAFWILTGIISLSLGWREGVALMEGTGAGALSGPGVVIGALADIAIGCAIAWRGTARAGLWAAIALSIAYLVLGTILAPALWAEPLGPLLKILPILVLHFVALAVLEER